MSNPPVPQRLAVIDIGSNSIKVTLAELTPSGPLRLKELRYPVRLGRGVFTDGRILKEDQVAAIAALQDLRDQARLLGIQDFHAVGTSAMREAIGVVEFLALVYATTGITIRIISGEEEARLVAASTRAIPGSGCDRLLIDIGGGSTEIIHMDGRGQLHSVLSLPLGAVRLAGWLGNPALYRAEDITRLHTYIHEVLSQHPIPVIAGSVECLGTGGTISALIDLSLRLRERPSTDPSPEKPTRHLTGQDIQDALIALQDKTHSELTELLGIQPERTAILPAGAAILSALARHYNLTDIHMRRCGLRDGLLQQPPTLFQLHDESQ